jgi:hypothetical protein
MKYALLGLALLSNACPHPKPDPFPTNTDAAVLDAPAADCKTFAGKYIIVDTTTDSSSCSTKMLQDILQIEVGDRDPDSGQWDVMVTGNNTQWLGLAKQLEDRSYVCRFVVEMSTTTNPGLNVINRDFVLGEEPGKGRGEAIIKNGDCLWQSQSLLIAK